MFDYSKLRGRIRELYLSESAFSEAMGMMRGQFSKKMTDKAGLSQHEIIQAADLLRIPHEQVFDYFLTKKLSNVTTPHERTA